MTSCRERSQLGRSPQDFGLQLPGIALHVFVVLLDGEHILNAGISSDGSTGLARKSLARSCSALALGILIGAGGQHDYRKILPTTSARNFSRMSNPLKCGIMISSSMMSGCSASSSVITCRESVVVTNFRTPPGSNTCGRSLR